MRHCLLLLLSLIVVPSALAADIDVVRRQLIDSWTGAAADPSAPRMRIALSALEDAARANTAPGFLLSDGSWSDLNYSETPSGSWAPWDHMRRLAVMARAYQTPGQALYRDPQLLVRIKASLGYVDTFYGLNDPPLGNWWFWTIGVPLDLGPTLVLMRQEIDPAVYATLVRDLRMRIGSSPTARGISGPVPAGENLVWSSWTHLYLALLEDDEAMLFAVRNAMAGVTRIAASGEGIKADSSFHQHGPQLYTGGYGGAFANDVSRYALITRSTAYALPPDSLTSFSNYLADGIAFSLYGNFFDVSVVGREVVRRSISGINGLAALIQAAAFDSPRATEIRAVAAQMLRSWQWTLPVDLAAMAVNTEQRGDAPAWPAGHRHYPQSDYAIHRRDRWFASVKMFSSRTNSGESTNGENLLGSRQSDGRFQLVLDGDEYFAGDVWPAFDWSRLPGITVEQKSDAADASYGYGRSSFAGGVSDGWNGVAAMELLPLNSSLTAKKSWFFFDDAIVFLTSGISTASSNRVETIVNQWPVKNHSSTVSLGQVGQLTQWAAFERAGYWFPVPSDLRVAREQRSGTWAALGGSSDTSPVSREILTLWLDHGTAAVGASSAYAVVPDVSADEMLSWSASRPLEIIRNDPNVAAVRDRRSGALGIVFFSAGSAEGITTNAPAIVYLKSDRLNRHLSIADPNAGNSGTIIVTIDGRFTAEGASAELRSSRTELTIPKAGGRTIQVSLSPAPTRRRTARH